MSAKRRMKKVKRKQRIVANRQPRTESDGFVLGDPRPHAAVSLLGALLQTARRDELLDGLASFRLSESYAEFVEDYGSEEAERIWQELAEGIHSGRLCEEDLFP
jgi:hypothetical protein